jgi:hypothetical protein
MGTLFARTLAVGICAGFLLVRPAPGGVHAAGTPDLAAPSVSGQDAADPSSTAEAGMVEADTVEADTVEADTISREGLSPVVQFDNGLSVITGSVTTGEGSEESISAAVVTLKRTKGSDAEGLRTETDEYGRFRFEGIPSGDYLVETHHLGYQDRTDTVRVEHRALLALDVPLTTQAVELPPIEVSVRSAWLAQTGFYWRKERGLGQFMSPEEVDRRSANSFSELVRGVPGVQVVRVCDDSFPCDKMIRMRHTNSARRCRVQYYMDGQPMGGRVYPDDISAHDIAAIEVYRNIAETPAQFYSRCGSVVMWSKRFDPRSRDG